jgi:outer membrane protein assembly factor BamB
VLLFEQHLGETAVGLIQLDDVRAGGKRLFAQLYLGCRTSEPKSYVARVCRWRDKIEPAGALERNDMTRDNRSPSRPRWWPALVILVLVLIALGWVWLGSDDYRQMKVTWTALSLVVGSIFLLVWLSFFSRFRWKTRFATWGVLIAAGALFFSAFRFRGVTGDLVPVFDPRWRGEAETISGEAKVGDATYDYPQFLGTYRNGTVPGLNLARDWSAEPPRLVWRRSVGKGWSSFAVKGDIAVTQEQHGDEERIICYDLKTGEIRWSTGDKASYVSPVAGDGPRSTPTIIDGRVYATGSTGLIHALDLESGQVLWSRNFIEENGATIPEFGKSCSPLVVDGKVIVSAGGPNGKSLIAYDQQTGEVIWQAGDDKSAYASPFVATLAGVRQIIILNARSVAGHAVEDGRILWSHPWPGGQPNVSQPTPLPGDHLLVTVGYGIGSKLFKIAPVSDGSLSAKLVWETTRMKAKFANPVFYDGFIYGLDDGILACQDPETGQLKWKRGRYGHGQTLLVGDLLFVQTEKGEIVLAEPTPEEFRELTRFRIMDGKVWNAPALAGPYLLVRTDQEAALFELPLRES